LLGNDQDAANRALLQDHRISHVINVTSHVPLYFESDGVKYVRFSAADSGVQNLRQYFEEALGFIGRHFNVLTLTDAVWVQLYSILCHTGLSRSFVIFDIRAL